MVRMIVGRTACRVIRRTGQKMFALRTIAAFVFALHFTPVLAGPLEDANAAERRDDYATAIRTDIMKRRDELATKMTPSQIAEAQKLAREWKPNKQP
jgi:hypothetical protein